MKCAEKARTTCSDRVKPCSRLTRRYGNRNGVSARTAIPAASSRRPAVRGTRRPVHSAGRASTRCDERNRREREKVSARQALEHEPAREVSSVPDSRPGQQRIERREREREELQVQILDFRKPRQRQRVERHQ